MYGKLDLGAEFLEIEVTLDPSKCVVAYGAAISQVDERPSLRLDHFTAQLIVGRNMVAVQIRGVERLWHVLEHMRVAVAHLFGKVLREFSTYVHLPDPRHSMAMGPASGTRPASVFDRPYQASPARDDARTLPGRLSPIIAGKLQLRAASAT